MFVVNVRASTRVNFGTSSGGVCVGTSAVYRQGRESKFVEKVWIGKKDWKCSRSQACKMRASHARPETTKAPQRKR